MQHCSSLSTAREKEELVRGAEVLDNTLQWFQSKLAVLSLEEQQRLAGNGQVEFYRLCAFIPIINYNLEHGVVGSVVMCR